ncbi:MAG: orotidine-5'-phosphate decarboxylase [Phycisphaerales bacterium]
MASRDARAAADRLAARLERAGSPICVGLDPVVEQLPSALAGVEPAEAIERFCLGVLDAVEGIAGAVKPQSACFERHGPAGVAALARVMAAASGRFEVILDAKRGDIGLTAAHYAAAARHLRADWVTANGYLGADGLRPFLEAGLGVFALVRTSNPGGDAVQSRVLQDGRTVAEMIADMVASEGAAFAGESGWSNLGAVVGATKARDAAALRARMPHQLFLVPGFGAQGGGVDDVRACLGAGGGGVVVTASRSVTYAFQGRGDVRWTDAVAEAARHFHAQLAPLGAAGAA